MHRLLSIGFLTGLAAVSYAAPSVSACANTFANGGFESGLSHWSKVTEGGGLSSVKVVTPGIHSKHAALMTLEAQDGEGDVGLGQGGFSLCPGNYTVDLDFDVVASSNDGVALQLILDNDQNQTSYIYNGFGSSGLGHYTEVFTTTKKNQNNHDIYFFAHNYNAEANMTIKIDNVKLTRTGS